jgi:CRP/FNR family transcriptional regulator, cyclic AMP receptor protein
VLFAEDFMHLPIPQSDSITDIAIKCNNLPDLLLENLVPSAGPISLSNSSDVFANQPSTRFFRIREGQVFHRVRGKMVTVFDSGDMIGLNHTLNLSEGTFSCTAEVVLIPYERDQLIAHIYLDTKLHKTWAYYLTCQMSFYQQALAQEIRSEFQPYAGFSHFDQGDIIIRQGDEADRVYNLLEGSADAICDGIKLGEIRPPEMFGALSVFTRQARTASVIATSRCLVLAVRKEEFVDLMTHQPQVCLNLIEEMAEKINSLNTQLLTRK